MIIVECYSDTTLVQCLTSLPRQDISHVRGKAEVCKQLSVCANGKGLIDEDPDATSNPFEKDGVVNDEYAKYDIRHLRYPSGNELIILCPKLEDWFLKTTKISGIDVLKHGLPDNPNKLHSVIDQRLDEFRTLLNMLKKQKSERISILTDLLKS